MYENYYWSGKQTVLPDRVLLDNFYKDVSSFSSLRFLKKNEVKKSVVLL